MPSGLLCSSPCDAEQSLKRKLFQWSPIRCSEITIPTSRGLIEGRGQERNPPLWNSTVSFFPCKLIWFHIIFILAFYFTMQYWNGIAVLKWYCISKLNSLVWVGQCLDSPCPTQLLLWQWQVKAKCLSLGLVRILRSGTEKLSICLCTAEAFWKI